MDLTDTASQIAPTCKACSALLDRSALACHRCHTLVHAEELNRLSAAAKFSEEHNDLARARKLWQDCLPLLPPSTEQAEWIRKHLDGFPTNDSGAQPNNPWVKRLGPLAP